MMSVGLSVIESELERRPPVDDDGGQRGTTCG